MVGCVCAALALAGAAQGALSVGVTEDAGKAGDAFPAFFSTMADIGLTQNRVSINWDPSQPSVILGQPEIVTWLPQALTVGTRIVFSVAPLHARDLTSSPDAPAQFASFLQQVATAFPQVKDYVIGNEPNQPYFWLPQFNSRGKALSAAAYEPVLARSYDTLKAVDPTINVIGVGLSPRGNDSPKAKNNVSRSPVRFLNDLGAAYRASHRAKPIMDELAFHPYPHSSADSIATGYSWPNAGIVNLDRIKQAVWDAFHGTAQPTFAEPGARTARKARSFSTPLTFVLDEVGWQVAVQPDLATLYFGTKAEPTTDEITQARIYGNLIKRVECDPSVQSLSFFHLTDEANLGRWQSGLERVDGSHRPSYEAVKQTIAQTHGLCQGTQVSWTHATTVVSPKVPWSKRRTRSSLNTNWSFVAAAGEEASYRVGIFKYGLSNVTLGRRLARARPAGAVLLSTGKIPAKSRVIYFPSRRLKPGRYVYAIRMASTMNPQRTSLLVSSVFRVIAQQAPSSKRH